MSHGITDNDHMFFGPQRSGARPRVVLATWRDPPLEDVWTDTYGGSHASIPTRSHLMCDRELAAQERTSQPSGTNRDQRARPRECV
jgi:hypothetical protein